MYRKVKYQLKNKNKQDQLYQLAKLESKDCRSFWKTVKKITSKRMTEDPNISPDDWVGHFSKLLNIKKDDKRGSTFSEYVETSLTTIENLATEGDLDHNITLRELKRALQKTKNGKSTGPDLISNEMLKYGGGTPTPSYPNFIQHGPQSGEVSRKVEGQLYNSNTQGK